MHASHKQGQGKPIVSLLMRPASTQSRYYPVLSFPPLLISLARNPAITRAEPELPHTIRTIPSIRQRSTDVNAFDVELYTRAIVSSSPGFAK